jgi:glycosyltransferase involved in cell wall biosynthesis
VCHASLEKNYYKKIFGSQVARKIWFVPFGRSSPLTNDILINKKYKDRYFFSGGTSNRDYETLIKSFVGTDLLLIVACHPNDVRNLEVPGNVIVRHDIFGAEFQEYIDNSVAVILPILHTNVSAGQLVLMDAMRSGKATIVTLGSCMEDYVDASCAMRVPKQDIKAMAEAISEIDSNEVLRKQLGSAAKIKYESEFTRKAFASRLCNIFLKKI